MHVRVDVLLRAIEFSEFAQFHGCWPVLCQTTALARGRPTPVVATITRDQSAAFALVPVYFGCPCVQVPVRVERAITRDQCSLVGLLRACACRAHWCVVSDASAPVCLVGCLIAGVEEDIAQFKVSRLEHACIDLLKALASVARVGLRSHGKR